MKKMIIILFLILIHSSSFAAKWDKSDKILFNMFTTGMIIDCLQTNYIFTHNGDGYHEKNSTIKAGVHSIGRGFIPLWFGSFILGSWYVLDKSPAKIRKFTLVGLILVKGNDCGRNYRKGIGLNFKF